MSILERKSYDEVKANILKKKTNAENRDYNALKKNIVTKRVDSDYLNGFIKDVGSFFEVAGANYDGMGYKNAAEVYGSTKETFDGLRKKASTINMWLSYNKDNLSEKDYTNLHNIISSFDQSANEVVSAYQRKKNAIASFKSEEEYTSALNEMKKTSELLNFDLEKSQEEIDALKSKNKEWNDTQDAVRIAFSDWQDSPEKVLSRKPGWYESPLTAEERKALSDEGYRRRNLTIDSAIDELRKKENVSSEEKELIDLYDKYMSMGGYEGDIREDIRKKEEYHEKARSLQYNYTHASEYEAVRNSSDFEEYRAKGASASDNGLDVAARLEYKSDYDKYLARLAKSNSGHRDVFDYYWGKGEYEKAKIYALDISDRFEYEYALKRFEKYDDKTLREVKKNFLSGIGSTLDNIGKFFTEDYDKSSRPTSDDYLQSMINEDLREEKKWGISSVAGDLAYTFGELLPAAILSPLNLAAPGLGTFLSSSVFGISARSGAIEQALQEGYTLQQAKAYGNLVGASEVFLEKFLGGITALGGGKLAGSVTEKLAGKLDDVFAKASFKGSKLIGAFAKATVDVGGNMASEALEESLQTVLEPWFKTLTTGADYDAPEWEEVAYSGLLGALSAGLLEGTPYSVKGVATGIDAAVGGVKSKLSEIREYKDIAKAAMTEIDSGVFAEGISYAGETLDEGSSARKATKKAAKTQSALDIGKAMVSLNNELTDEQRSNLKGVLVERGVAESDAEIITKWFSKVTKGESLTEAQEIAFSENEVVTEAVKDVIINEETTGGDVEFEWTGRNIIATTSEEVEIADIAEIKNRKVYVKLENGKVVDADNISFGSKSEEIFYQAAKDMTKISASKMLEGFKNSGMDPVEYLKGFREAHRFGKYGFGEDAAKNGKYAAALPTDILHTAYSMGVLDSNENVTKLQKERKAQKSKEKKKGNVVLLEGKNGKTVEVKGEQRKSAVKAAEALTKVTGNTVYFYESYALESGDRVYKNPLTGEITKNAPNGFITPEGDIYIDINAGMDGEGLALFTLGHEVSHFIRKFSPQKFKTFADVIMQVYVGRGYNVDTMVKQRMEEMLEGGELKETDSYDKNYDIAYEEIVARACESMFRDSDALEKVSKEMVRRDGNLWEKVKDALLAFVEKIKKAYASIAPQTEEAKILLEMKKATEKVGKLWADALLDASENYNGNAKGGVRLSKRKTDSDFQKEYEKNVDAVLNGTYKSDNPIIVGRTPESLTNIGLNQLPLTITAKHIYSIVKTEDEAKQENRYSKNTNYHGLGADAVKQIGEKLSSPIAIIAHQEFTEAQRKVYSQGHKIVVVVELQIEGKQVICPIEVDAKIRKDTLRYDVNHISTYFDKDNFKELLGEAIAKENIGKCGFYFLDKEKADTLLQGSGYQLPQQLANRISAFGSIIRHISENVNRKISHFTESQQFKRFFGDWQNSPGSASKVVNADGTPKVMYHGSPNDFTVFDKKKAKYSGYYGKGFYFTDSESHAGQYGRQYKVYLNIRRPLKVGETKVTEAHIRKFLEAVAENEDYSIENYGTYDIDTILKGITSRDAFGVLMDVNTTAIGNLVEAVQLWNEVNDESFDGIIVPTETVAFYPEQIKSATDNVGTFDKNNPDIRYSSRGKATVSKEFADKTLESFGITKLTDAIHVQRQVLSTLESEGFFTDAQTRSRTDVNEESGMIIETNKSGIDETFSLNNFVRLGRFKKIAKLAIIRELPTIIKNGRVLAYDVENKYDSKDKNKTFAYIEGETTVDGENIVVKLAIKKSSHKNKFWVHSIYTIENVSDSPAITEIGNGAGHINADTGSTIPQDSSAVNTQNSEVKKSSRGMMGAFAEDRAAVEEAAKEGEAALKKEMDDMRELVELQREANAKKPSKNAVSIIAGKLRTIAKATKGDKTALEKKLGELYLFISSSTPESLTWEAFTEKAKPIVDMLMSDRTADVHVDERAESILKDLHSRRISLDEVQKAEVTRAFDKFGNYRKRTMGSFVLADTDATSLAKTWQEMSELYPEYFSSDVNHADMPLEFLDVIERLKDSRTKEDAGLTERMLSVELLQSIYEGYWSVTNIYTVSDVKAQKDISSLNAKHKEQMAKVREARDESVKKLTAEHQSRVDALKDRIKKREGAIIDDYQDMLDRKLLRNKISKLYNDMDRKLTRPTKKKHVLEKYQGIVADLLAAFSVDSIKAEAQLNGYTDENGVYHVGYREKIIWEKNPEKKKGMEEKISQLEKAQGKIKEKLSALREAYSNLETDEEGKSQYEEVIRDLIVEAQDVVGDTPVGRMSLRQLKVVYELFRAVSYKINMEDRLFGSDKKESLSKTSERIQGEIIENLVKPKDNAVLDKVRGTQTYSSLKTGFNDTAYKVLNPIGVIETFGSKTLVEAFMEMRKGEDDRGLFMNEAISYTQKMYEKYDLAEWVEADKESGPMGFIAVDNSEIPFTLEERMSIYALSQRQSAREHLLNGGIVPTVKAPKKIKKDGKNDTVGGDKQKTYKATEDMLLAVENSLTQEQKAFVADMVAFLSGPLAEKGNEATMKLYGIKLFTEEWYFPMKVASSTLESKPGGDRAPTLKGWGATFAVNPEAKNPLIISNFLDMWIEHVEGMANYYGNVVKVEDFSRIFNCKTENGDTVKKILAETYGNGAVRAIESLINDANGGIKRESELGVVAKLLLNSKKAAVVMKMSVGIQQVSSITRAWQEMNPKYFVDLKKLIDVKEKLPWRAYRALNADWEEAKKYAPIALVKELGGFDVGSNGSISELMRPQKKAKKMIDTLGGFPGFMDKVGWTTIWRAVKREIADQYGVKKIDDAFLEKHGKECSERFTEVIHKTQVYDSVFSKSELMRSKSQAAQVLTAFKGESTKVLTMIWTTAVDARRLNAFDEKGKRNALAKIGRLVGVLLVTQAFNSALKALVNAGKDDDEDETWTEKYIQAFSSDYSSNVSIDGWLSLIPVMNELVSLWNGYRLKRLEFGLLEDLVYAIRAFDADGKTDAEKWSGFAFAISNLFGVPAENVYNDVKYMVNTIKTLLNDEQNTSMGMKEAFKEGWNGEETSDGELLYRAIIGGDKVYEERIRNRFDSDVKAKTALAKALRENDKRIKVAAEAKAKGDYKTYSATVNDIVGEGLFEKDVVVKAIMSEVSIDKEVSIYSASDVNVAFENGDDVFAQEIISDLVKTKVTNGATEKEARSNIRSQMTSYWKPIYKNSSKSEKIRIRKILLASGLYGRAGEVVKACFEWEREK